MSRLFLVCVLAASLCGVAGDDDVVMFGGDITRNMISKEKGLPAEWDVQTGKNVKWVADLGSQTYTSPTIHGGKVFIGTNNQLERNPKYKGDHGVVMAFRESDGEFLWQIAHPKLESGPVNDWPQQGVCSTPAVEGERIWYVSNRAEVICLDTEGFMDGENDGPYKDEADTGKQDADIIWKYDMMEELGVFPHNLAAGSPLLVGDVIFLVTGNGVDETHLVLPSPFAPSFIAINKNTGELLWENAGPGENVLHGQWSNAAHVKAGGKEQILMPGGDGWLYSLDINTGKEVWKFDLNPKDSVWELGGSGTRNNIISTPVVHDGVVYLQVGQDPEHGEGGGHFYAIDPTKTGDVTTTAKIWHVGDDDYHRSISTISIKDGLIYAADFSGFLYCMDAKTGEKYWTYDTFAAVWGSTMVADGKVYLGDEDGDVVVLKTGKEKEMLFEGNMGSAVYSTPVAANGVLYIANRTKLYALDEGIPAKQ